MMSEFTYSIAKKFSKHPGPRYVRQGPDSGELLRRRLNQILSEVKGTVLVDLDGTTGFGSSFLDEAFGGLIRSDHWQKDQLLRRLQFRSTLDPSYVDEIMDSINKAKPAEEVSH